MHKYGFLLARQLKHGSEYISANLVYTENKDYPLNCCSNGESTFDRETPKIHAGLHYSNLGINGHISDYNDLAYCGFEAKYHEPYTVTLPTAERMIKTLRKIQREVKKANAEEPGDYLMAVAKALHLDFVVIQRGPRNGSMYSDCDWTFMTVEEGRNLFRKMIDDARADVRKCRNAAA